MNFIPPQDETRLRAAASGVLPNGKPVVVNADGTVSVVSGIDQSVGSAAVFESATTDLISATFDSNLNKVVIAYQDEGNSNYGTSVVGTVSGSSISFGTPAVFRSANSDFISSTFDSNSNKVVIAFRDVGNSARGKAIVGTVSGTDISFGSTEDFNSSEINSTATTFDSNSNKVVISWNDKGNSERGVSIVGTVSGTSISFGSAEVFAGAITRDLVSTFDSNSNKVVISFRDVGNSSAGTVIIGTVSGTSISFGTEVVFQAGAGDLKEQAITFDTSSNKVVIAYANGANSDHGTAIVGTVSGTSISFGTPVVFEAASVAIARMGASYDSSASRVVISYRDNGNSNYGTLIVGAVSGTSISFESAVVYEAATTDDISSTFDSNSNKVVIAYQDGGNSNYGTAVVTTTGSTNLTTENYVGMSGGVVIDSSVTQELGTPVTFESGDTDQMFSATFDSNSNKVVIVYQDVNNSQYGTAIVGTVSGTSISFGTPVVFETAHTINPSATFDSNSNKVVIAYNDVGNSQYGTAIVGTVSGTGISFGTPVVFESAASNYFSATFDSNLNKVVIAYRDDGNSNRGTAVVGTVSGTNISFGSAVVFETGNSTYINAVFDSNSNKVVIVYRDGGNSNYGTAIVGTVSGTGISFGTAAVFSNQTTTFISSTFDSANSKIVITYRHSGNSNIGSAIVGTVSGTSISFGTEAVFSSNTVATSAPVFDSNINKIVVVYRDAGNSNYATVVVGTVSGTSISFGSSAVFDPTTSAAEFAVFDSSNNRVVAVYEAETSSTFGRAAVIKAGFTEINRGQVAASSSASVDIIGTVSENQLSLTPGQSYFVQTDGTITTTAGSPSVFAGTAISATKLLVKA